VLQRCISRQPAMGWPAGLRMQQPPESERSAHRLRPASDFLRALCPTSSTRQFRHMRGPLCSLNKVARGCPSAGNTAPCLFEASPLFVAHALRLLSRAPVLVAHLFFFTGPRRLDRKSAGRPSGISHAMSPRPFRRARKYGRDSRMILEFKHPANRLLARTGFKKKPP